MSSFDSFFQAVQKATLPGVWSKGVSLSRENTVVEDSRSPKGDEINLRIRLPNRPISPKVNLWPEDQDWYCDCGDQNDPCFHIVAAVVALKNGTLASTPPETPSSSRSPLPELHYCLIRKDQSLALERWIVRGESREPLTQSLIQWIGGISSGRISAPPVPATQDDFAVDQIFQNTDPGTPLDRATLSRLIPALRHCPRVFLDGIPIQISSQKVGLKAKLTAEKGGFQLSLTNTLPDSELFRNGAALQKTESGLTLFLMNPLQDLGLTPQEREGFRFYPNSELARLTAEIIPSLQSKMEVDLSSVQIPKAIQTEPRILLKSEKLDGDILVVTASLVYGEPPIAELTPNERDGDRITYLSRHEVPLRNIPLERKLTQQLQSELHLGLGSPVRLIGKDAIDFTRRARNWNFSGTAAQEFTLSAPLQPRVETQGSSFQMFFESKTSGTSSTLREADPGRVFEAWRQNLDYVPLIGGGYAPLPTDWLNRYGERILSLASYQEAQKSAGNSSKSSNSGLPRHFLPELADLCQELGCDYPESLKKLQQALNDHSGIPQAQLPADLQAQLRHYQKEGINWLCFLRDSGMGALLADDMGLGKTLQALSAIQKKTLIICPTSVLQSWAEQIEKFRPSLRYSIYHGSERKENVLNSQSEVILTSYGILRLDIEKLNSSTWDTIILDEAQTIKNPQSQIAQAAHRLRGSFKIALSGTPVENRLEDLWSQFQFINPGLLGDSDEFKTDFIEPISRGDRSASDRLKKKIRPFLLRRLKKEVAPELPPRTEIILHCELSSSERDLYDAILASTQKEVITQLETGGSIFAALEALLRLRQACCHPLLVPGEAQRGTQTSSKLDLLVESLEESISLGHRALVFSQWTSLLDLVETALKPNFRTSRLDGATRNRAEVIAEFQRPDGPEVMLLSLKAGGVGITLTAADHIYILDPWWNPAAENQAADRAHRIGQENPVLIHRLVARNTVEDRILALQKKKQELAAAILGEGSGALSLTRDDLLDLLT